MRTAFAMLVACAVLATAAPARADDTPSDRNLILAGLGMAAPTYLLGVVTHEGSHAISARLMGADVTEYSLLPGPHPRTGKFYFAYVQVHGLQTVGEKTFFYVAPKLADLIPMGTYAALIATGTVPENRYGRLAMAVLATGFWVDFSKDIISFWDHNDIVKTYNLHGYESEWSRLPWRFLHAGVSAAFGYAIYRGYEGVFEDGDSETSAMPLIAPLYTGRF